MMKKKTYQKPVKKKTEEKKKTKRFKKKTPESAFSTMYKHR